MRVDIEKNLKVIRKYLKKRKKFISKLNNVSIMEEFKEWSKDPIRNRTNMDFTKRVLIG